jgi:hypothetical protein
MGDAMEEDEPYVDDGHKTKAELDKQRTTTNAEIEKDMAERVKKRLAFIERQTDLLLHFDPKVIPCLPPFSSPRVCRHPCAREVRKRGVRRAGW